MSFATGFLGLVLFSIACSVAFGVYAFWQRNLPGALPFVLVMVGQGIWSAGYFGELLAFDQAAKTIWDNVQFSGLDAAAGGSLLFALAYVGWAGGRWRWLLLIVPLLSLVVVWTDPAHALVRVQPRVALDGLFPNLVYGYGYWMWLLISYNYALLMMAIGVLALASTHSLYRVQMGAMMVALAIPLGSTLLTILGLVPIPSMHRLDISPVAFAIATPLLAWGLFAGGRFDLVSLAQARLIKQLADGVLVVDRHGQLVDCSPRALTLLDMPAGVGVGASLVAALPWTAELLNAAEATTMELHRAAAGTRYDLEVSVTPLLTGQDKRVGWLLVLRDITARLEAEATAGTQETLLQSILDNAPLVINVVDLEGRYLLVNRSACDVMQLAAEELLGRPFDAFFPPELCDRVRSNFATVRATLQPVTEEYTVPTPEGLRTFVQVSFPIVDTQGRLHTIGNIATDISENKRAEAALRASEARFQQIAAHLQDIIWIVDLRTDCVQYISPAFEKLTGYSPASIEGQILLETDLVHPEDRTRLQRELERPTDQPRAVEFRLVRADGALRWVQARSFPMIAEDGSINQLVGITTDITARKQAEAEREQLERDLQATQRLESLGVLAGGIAHDFNNILASILGYADLARLEVVPQSDADEYLEKVISNGRRAADLTGQILAYAGRGRFVVEPVLLNELVRASHELAQVSTLRQARIQYALADALPPILADVTQLRQVVLNLLTNAAEASAGAAEVRIETAYEQLSQKQLERLVLGANLPEGSYVRLTVVDQGAGMDEATLARIFEPFYTTKFTGRGLGLAVVHGIVRSHHGTLAVESSRGHGTRFSVWFPALNNANGESTATTDLHAAAAIASTQSQGTLLIVDDEASVRQVAASLARRLGYAVCQAEHGPAAMAHLREGIPNLCGVLLDLTMPEMNGEVVAQAIRELHPQLPIILMSGYSAYELAERFGHLRFHGMLPKPFGLEQLRSVLATLQNPPPAQL